ncbi:MAG: hypothetical protein WAZ19_07515 [Anaerolineae bacterium]
MSDEKWFVFLYGSSSKVSIFAYSSFAEAKEAVKDYMSASDEQMEKRFKKNRSVVVPSELFWRYAGDKAVEADIFSSSYPDCEKELEYVLNAIAIGSQWKELIPLTTKGEKLVNSMNASAFWSVSNETIDDLFEKIDDMVSELNSENYGCSSDAIVLVNRYTVNDLGWGSNLGMIVNTDGLYSLPIFSVADLPLDKIVVTTRAYKNRRDWREGQAKIINIVP